MFPGTGICGWWIQRWVHDWVADAYLVHTTVPDRRRALASRRRSSIAQSTYLLRGSSELLDKLTRGIYRFLMRTLRSTLFLSHILP